MSVRCLSVQTVMENRMSRRTTFTEIAEKLGVSKKTVDEMWVNPLRLLVSDEFNRRDKPGEPSYRERAIKRAIASRMSFESEDNTVFEMMEQFVKVICPCCGGETKFCGGGGVSGKMRMEYTCKRKGCNTTVNLTVAEGALSVKLEE